ncbi:MAG: MaoC family dehydratase [Planctomycetaceae bacterium]|nr:MaoC family dehydratase [Planctomycetaceae bacterium]
MESASQDHARQPLYFEDLHVGLRYVTGSRRIDEAEMVSFASEFDPQSFHTDGEAAKGSFFQGLVASGWHTAGVTMRLMVESGLPIAGGLIGAGAEIAWPRPTRPGTTVHVESEIIELRPLRSRPDRGIAVVRNETRDENGDVVQVMTAKMLIPRRSRLQSAET